jgi:hypothetical protein
LYHLCHGKNAGKQGGISLKTVILGTIGAFIMVYTVITGLGVYNTETRYEEMENAISQVIKQTLEVNYGKQTTEQRKEQLVADIKYRMGSDSDVEVIIHSMHLQKGIISVTVKETFRQLNGKEKQLEWKKTAIIDFSLIRYLTEEELPKGVDGNEK